LAARLIRLRSCENVKSRRLPFNAINAQMPFPLMCEIIILKNARGGSNFKSPGVHNFERSRTRDANIGDNRRWILFVAMVFVYKYIMRDGEVGAGQETGARPTSANLICIL
jgi:hypothetical protein